jgi:predicted DNA-binding helix-hairpin-helix protein
MPGAEFNQVERSMQLANRVSINLEAPNKERLHHLAPRKQFVDELLQPLKWIDLIRNSQPDRSGWNGHWPSSVTQFVVSAIGETDLELMTTTEYLYSKLHLRRAYYSSFNPIPNTPLENVSAGSPVRANRLYEASYLLRDYGFCMEELPFDSSGQLPLDVDPKSAWARQYLVGDLIEINKADKHTLLRVPGIGPKSANAIIIARHKNKINCIDELHSFGVNLCRATPFILFNGKTASYQTSFL